MSNWTSDPETAWVAYVLPDASERPNWVNDSKPVSESIGLSKRELFVLIILAHAYNGGRAGWKLGYDPEQPEPNDGYITDGEAVIRVEHKVIVEGAKDEVLEELLSTYRRNAEKGPDYGRGRVLMIQLNKAPAPGGLARVSDLAREIGCQCNFDRVLTLSMVACKNEGNRTGVMHLIQHYPPTVKGIAQVDFDFPTGKAAVPHCGIAL